MTAAADEARWLRFRGLNDRIWGEGNWVMCPRCLDGLEQPSFHHKNAHARTHNRPHRSEGGRTPMPLGRLGHGPLAARIVPHRRLP